MRSTVGMDTGTATEKDMGTKKDMGMGMGNLVMGDLAIHLVMVVLVRMWKRGRRISVINP